MQVVDDFLHRFAACTRRRSECEDAKVRIPTHHVPDDAAVRVVSARAVRFVDDHARDVARIEAPLGEIAFDRLGRRVDDALREPADRPESRGGSTRELDAVGLWDPGDVVAGFDLLSHERTSRREEEHLALRVPPIEVEPVRRGRGEVRSARRRRQKGAGKEAHMTTAAINVFPRPVGKLTSVLSNSARWIMLS